MTGEDVTLACEFRNDLAYYVLKYLSSGRLRGFTPARRWRARLEAAFPQSVGSFQKSGDKSFSK